MSGARRRMTAEDRRTQLLDACAAIVDVEGFGAVTIDRVARACAVTRPVVYQHFGGLDGLLDALVERAAGRAAAAIAGAPRRRGRSSLRDVMADVLAAADADPATWRMFLVAPRAGPPALAASLARGRALIRERNAAEIAHRSGGAVADPELAARMLQVVADELVRLRLEDPSAYPVDRLLAQLDTVAAALLPTATPTGRRPGP